MVVALKRILEAFIAEYIKDRDKNKHGKELVVVDGAEQSLRQLVGAADLASSSPDLKLYVWLAPPGHTDFGFATTFPHCPTCKAIADQPGFGRPPGPIQTCRVCDSNYNQRETVVAKK